MLFVGHWVWSLDLVLVIGGFMYCVGCVVMVYGVCWCGERWGGWCFGVV